MSTLSFWAILKFTYKAIGFRLEQRKLTSNETVIVKTVKGFVKGIQRTSIWDDVYISFEKIPFAKPPLADLRFKAPVPNDVWTGVLDCTNYADEPMQTNLFFRKYKGSEDCLYLNVFTKNINPEKLRPVMVWIYGGGYQVGEATRDLYSPDFFMTKDIVLVTIAYRLGPLGFLSLNNPELNIPGNAGLKDQIMSLQWVKDNISAFGGDPNNVTLFGESAGGASTHYCMNSEQSKGLIHKAITMSGCVLCPWSNPPKEPWAYRLAKILGYEGQNIDKKVYQFLMLQKGSDLVINASKLLTKQEKHNRVLFAFGPVVEPYITEQCVIPKNPYETMQNTWSHQIPMMLGFTSFEGLLFYPEVTRRPATLNEVGSCKNLLPNDLDATNDNDLINEMAAKLKETYFGEEECSPATKMNFLNLETYREFLHPIYRTALCRSQRAEAPTYLYRFAYDSRDGNTLRNMMCDREIRGACHGDEVFYMFHNMLSNRFTEGTPENKMIRLLVDIWTNFAENSDPNCALLENVKFESLAKDEDLKCLNISDKCEFIQLPEILNTRVWNSFYPTGKL